jgi:hypothetical protein
VLATVAGLGFAGTPSASAAPDVSRM